MSHYTKGAPDLLTKEGGESAPPWPGLWVVEKGAGEFMLRPLMGPPDHPGGLPSNRSDCQPQHSDYERKGR